MTVRSGLYLGRLADRSVVLSVAVPCRAGLSGLCLPSRPAYASVEAESILGDARAGRCRLINLLIAGLICGVAWEFFNYWAGAKWSHTVPILPELRIFEMPLPGTAASRRSRSSAHDVCGRKSTNLARRGTPHLGIIRDRRMRRERATPRGAGPGAAARRRERRRWRAGEAHGNSKRRRTACPQRRSSERSS